MRGPGLNPNKFFSRLSIKAKLVVAFLLVAGVPLTAAGGASAWGAIRHLESGVRENAQYDLRLAKVRTEGSLRGLGQHLAFLSAAGATSLTDPTVIDEVEALVRLYLEQDRSPLFRVKVVDPVGRQILTAAVDPRDEISGGGGMYYAWRGSELGPGESTFLPVELRGATVAEAVRPAMAVIRPIYADGSFLGVIVGEADAPAVFAAIEEASPGLSGVTALVDRNGHFLYHSERKRDWAKLLATRETVDLTSELTEAETARILSDSSGLLSTSTGELIAFARVELSQGDTGPLVLYRTLPSAAVTAPVRSYVLLAGTASLVILPVVIFGSLLAAGQFTRPILRLQEAAAAVARGADLHPLDIETNDEIEDLARDFAVMADTVRDHRRHLEARVAEEAQARENVRAQLDEIVASSADAITVLDKAGHVVLWNRAMEAMFGPSEGEVLGRPLADVLRHPDGDNAQEEALFARARDRGEPVVGYRTRRAARAGDAVPVSLTLSTIHDAAGRELGTSLIFRDDRQQLRLEDQMRRSERLAATSIMAAGIAHELNNPLAILGNRIELMQRSASRSGDERLQRDLEVLQAGVGRLGSVTGDLLRFARDDNGAVGPVDVGAAVHRVVRLMERVLVAKDLALTVSIDHAMPLAFCSEAGLETVLINLLANAQQATPPGGQVRVEARVGAGDGYAEIEVRDSGPGVPVELRGSVFEPFMTTKLESGGSGLGLAVCRAVVERVGGRIWLDGAEGGASFVVTLPLAPKADDA